jgi:hypothetical protein
MAGVSIQAFSGRDGVQGLVLGDGSAAGSSIATSVRYLRVTATTSARDPDLRGGSPRDADAARMVGPPARIIVNFGCRVEGHERALART